MAVPISNVTRRQVYAPSGAGGAGPYAFTFEILANTDIAVYKDDVLLTLTTHYTVTINANGTGSVTITATGLALAPTSPTQYAIVGNRTISRTTDFTTGGDFFANTLNDELDQQTIFNQQNAEGLQRALAAPQTDPTSINMTLPRASLRANKALGFDANGNPAISDTLGTNRGNWAAGVLYYVRDIVKDTTNNNIWQCLVQHTSSGSQPINTNADSAKWSLLVDAASATTSASNAASSASAASTSASNASTSASNASTSASNASTSASNAASSASAASTSASNAAASYDSFDDRYLGSKSSAPSVDNDGNSLLTGALYWDTGLNQMRVWSGTAWVNINASASNTRTAITATAGQTVLTVATYTPGTNTMVVYVNGVKLNASEYTETNATTITVATGLALNDEVEVFSYRVNEIGTLGASSVTIADTGNYYAGGNVETALQEAATYTNPATGGALRTIRSKLSDTVDPRDFGAVGNGVADDTTPLNNAFATGKIVDGGGLTYKVTPSVVIDPYATGSVGYGAGKTWFKASVCRNISFIGNVSFGTSANFLGKHKKLEEITVTGDARFSAWYTTFQGVIVTGTTYINGDHPPDINWVGCYYNEFHNCDFVHVVIDQRYGPVNNNGFFYTQFETLHVKDTGNAGYGAGTQPYKDFHLNVFIGCEWFCETGITAPDGYTYPVVIEDTANIGGINRFIGCYMETTSRGFYGKGIEVENLHLSGTNVTVGGGQLGYNTPLSGEGGQIQRDVPHIYPAGDMLVGGDWSILDSSGKPYCLGSSGHTVTLGTDSQEPTGLSKYVQFAATGAFSTVSINFGAADSNNRTLRSFSIIYKVTAGNPSWEVQDSAGATVYGAENIVRLSNGWVMVSGHTYGIARMTSGSTYTVRVSAISAGRGAGVVSPVTNQPGGKPLLDLSGGASIINDYVDGSSKFAYNRTATKSMQSSSGNVDWFSLDFGVYTGRSAHIKVVFSLNSGGGGSRNFYRESIIHETGGASLSETNLHAISGANGSLSFNLSGAILTVRTTSSAGSAETARMGIQVLGYEMGNSRITVL